MVNKRNQETENPVSGNINAEVIQTLTRYKKLTSNAKNRPSLIKDKTVILCTAAFLDSQDPKIIDLCLNIMEDFIQDDNCHQVLVSTFGIFEALESLSIRLRSINSTQADRASTMVDILRKSSPPAYSTRSRTRGKQSSRNTTIMYQLYVPDLTIDNRLELEETLVKIKGIVSFVVDLEEQKCTIRITRKVTIETVLRSIVEKCGLKVLIVTKDAENVTEVHVDILGEQNKVLDANYFPEEDTPPREKSACQLSYVRRNVGSWIKSAANFWTDSLYW